MGHSEIGIVERNMLHHVEMTLEVVGQTSVEGEDTTTGLVGTMETCSLVTPLPEDNSTFT